MRGDVSKQDFLQELKFKKPTHQICFCTVASLQALTYLNSRKEWDIERIANNIVKQIVLDKHVDEITATDLFFSSQTFTLLKAQESQLHTKPWKEIYHLLKAELK